MLQMSVLDGLHCLLIIAGTVALIALSIVLFNLVITLKSLNKVMDQAQDIVVVAKESVDNAKEIVVKFNDVSTDVRSMVSTNKGTLAALGSLVNVGASLASLRNGREERRSRKK